MSERESGGEKRKAPTTGSRVEAEFFTQLAIRGTCTKYTARCRRK